MATVATRNQRFDNYIDAHTQVELSRSLARLPLQTNLDDLLAEAVAALGRVGVENAIALLEMKGSATTIIYKEYGAENSDFRYCVGGYFRRMARDGVVDVEQAPYYGWAEDRLKDGSAVYCAPLLVNGAVAGVIALRLPPSEQLSSMDWAALAPLAMAVGASASTIEILTQTRRRAEELQVLYEVGSIMAEANLDLKMLLSQTMLIASRVVRASASTLMLLDEQTNELVFEIPMGESGEALREFRLPYGEGIGGTVVKEGRPLLVNNVANDLRWSSLADRKTGFITRSILCVPMQLHGRVIGALEVLNKVDADGRLANFSRDDAALLSAIATQAGAAIENAQLYQSLLRERDHIISTEEEVRRSFNRDLHDGPAQGLAGIIMRLDIVKHQMQANPATAISELEAVQSLAKRTNKQIRDMLTQLRPIVLETRGLVAALEAFVQSNQGDGGITYQFASQPNVDSASLGANAEGAIYIIIQEAINNIKKHARAQNVGIKLSEGSISFNYTRSGKLRNSLPLHSTPRRCLIVTIRDDGRGFEVDKVLGGYSERGSYGLLNMRERAELLAGDLLISSEVGKGTIITVRIPYPNPAKR